MKVKDLIAGYVSPAKLLDEDVSAQDYYQASYHSAQVFEIESFMSVRFHQKFKEVVKTAQQRQTLQEKAKAIAMLAQKMFELRFPEFASATPTPPPLDK